MEQKKEYYSLKEAAKILDIDYQDLYYKMTAGVFSAEKKQVDQLLVRKVWAIKLSELERLRSIFEQKKHSF